MSDSAPACATFPPILILNGNASVGPNSALTLPPSDHDSPPHVAVRSTGGTVTAPNVRSTGFTPGIDPVSDSGLTATTCPVSPADATHGSVTSTPRAIFAGKPGGANASSPATVVGPWHGISTSIGSVLIVTTPPKNGTSIDAEMHETPASETSPAIRLSASSAPRFAHASEDEDTAVLGAGSSSCARAPRASRRTASSAITPRRRERRRG